MPHRDPIVAAVARCTQLRARIEEIAPGAGPRAREITSIAEAVAERARLVAILDHLSRGEPSAREPATPRAIDDELPATVLDAHGENDTLHGGEPYLARRSRRRDRVIVVTGLAAGAATAILGVCLLHASSSREHELARARASAPALGARGEGVVQLHGDVIGRWGHDAAPEIGERCTVGVTAHGERTTGPECRVDVVCGGGEHAWLVGCPADLTHGPLHITGNNGLIIDAPNRRLKFEDYTDGELYGVELALSE